MSKAFGRSRRRKMRAQIAGLEATASSLKAALNEERTKTARLGHQLKMIIRGVEDIDRFSAVLPPKEMPVPPLDTIEYPRHRTSSSRPFGYEEDDQMVTIVRRVLHRLTFDEVLQEGVRNHLVFHTTYKGKRTETRFARNWYLSDGALNVSGAREAMALNIAESILDKLRDV